MKNNIITIDEYLTVKTSTYDLIKSYTVFYSNKFNAEIEHYNKVATLYYPTDRPENKKYFQVPKKSLINYGNEKSNCGYFLFHNDAEKAIMANNIIYKDDDSFMKIILESKTYDLLLGLIYELNKINQKDADISKRKFIINAFLNTYVKKNNEQFTELQKSFKTYKGEFNLINTINKFTEIYVFNQPLINEINGYEEEEKVYTK